MENNDLSAKLESRGAAPHHADGASSAATSLYDVDSTDPESKLVDRTGLEPEGVAQITRLMNSMANLRLAEEALSKASQKFMQLSETEMRGIHYLIVAANRNEIVTPGAIASHLGITSASTTKLLDRLERGDHIVRSPHPTDRRALSISVTEETHAIARDTVGRTHANRFIVAASLSPAERDVVIGFLDEVAERMKIGQGSWATEAATH